MALGRANHVPSLDDLKTAAHSPLAAALLELPMREIGGQLPSWEDLVEQARWCKEQGIRLHMDGARLWQCTAHYDKTLTDISALFDSVYVSFYKDLGGIAGACLAGDADFIERCKVWIRRAGGNLYALAPYIIAAREGLKNHLPHIPERHQNATWYAEQLNRFPHFKTWLLEPQTNMFRLRVDGNPDNTLLKIIEWMTEHDCAMIAAPYDVGEDHFMCELTIGDAFNEKEKADWLTQLNKFVNFIFYNGETNRHGRRTIFKRPCRIVDPRTCNQVKNKPELL